MADVQAVVGAEAAELAEGRTLSNRELLPLSSVELRRRIGTKEISPVELLEASLRRIEEINPAVNAIQSLVAVTRDGRWRIALFQNTPAQFHGRPELAQQLTEELRQLLAK